MGVCDVCDYVGGGGAVMCARWGWGWSRGCVMCVCGVGGGRLEWGVYCVCVWVGGKRGGGGGGEG